MSQQNTLLEQLSTDVCAIKAQNAKIQKTNLDIEKSIESIKSTCTNLSQRIETFEKDRQIIQETLIKLDNDIDAIKLTSRPSSIEIRNVPNHDNETTSQLLSIVESVCKTINSNFDKTLVRDIYRLPSKQGKLKPIVIEFTTVQQKNDIIAAVRRFNKTQDTSQKLSTHILGLTCTPTQIYISEYLPGPTRRLFFLAREHARKLNFKFCWSINGKIYLRKDENSVSYRIHSEKVLHNIPKIL
ncbi:hypothetical protein K1T71_002566 [Dendrolimus kikuchii]|uniref:Uncharacterized protein n=1 Tax=Dendrolimus kikuchii TaxID=765133 RepID=A0ACC1DD18_9NEOP|nr:hypothetical protein K1T71_002566 [Dendrolimus kikuchii]